MNYQQICHLLFSLRLGGDCRGFLGFPRLPWKEFGFVFKSKVHLLSTIPWLQHSKAIVLTENVPAPKASPQ